MAIDVSRTVDISAKATELAVAPKVSDLQRTLIAEELRQFINVIQYQPLLSLSITWVGGQEHLRIQYSIEGEVILEEAEGGLIEDPLP